MGMIAVVAIGLFLVFPIWVIVQAVRNSDRFNQLTRRVQDLEIEVTLLRKAQQKESARTVESKPETPPVSATPPVVPKPFAFPPAPPAPVSPLIPVAPVIPVSPQPHLVTPAPEIPEPVVPPPFDSFMPPATPPPVPEFAKVAESEPEPEKSTFAKQAAPEPQTESARITEPPPVPEKSSFEMRLGMFWFARIGAVLVLTGIVFFGNLAFQALGPGGKLAMLYGVAALLLGLGAWWQRKTEKPAMRNYAQVLFAGGLAAVYFTTYAAHHVTQLLVIQSPTVDGILLLLWAGFMTWIADRQKSEILALFAVGLAYYTSIITHVGAFTLYSNLLLTLVAVVFLVRNRWAGLSFASLVATYVGYAFWRFFGDDGWHWAAPGESLWFGATFLASYWVAFTAATFLSKGNRLAGEIRSVFLTLNNSAFFALFLLTMWQVHSGGFWKFSLIYGSALLALAALAKNLLADEPLTKNSYLTQGLLLVTLGFISKFTGMQLALVLGVESVTLYVLGTMRKSLLLQVGGYLTAALAVGWGIDGMERFDHTGMILGMALGAFMLVNALFAHKQTPQSTTDALRPQPAFFTLLALIAWGVTTWQNTEPTEFGLVLTVEALLLALSTHLLRVPEVGLFGQIYVLVAQTAWMSHVPPATAHWTALALSANCFATMQLGRLRKDVAFKGAATISAALASAWAIGGLERNDLHGLSTGAGVAVMMMICAAIKNRRSVENISDALRPGPTYFSLLTVVLAFATTWYNVSEINYPVALALETLVLTVSIYLLGVRELVLLGQFLLLAGHFIWQYNRFNHGAPIWWNPAIMIGVTLALAHWWQKQRLITFKATPANALQLILSLLIVLLTCTWLKGECSGETWLELSCLLAVAVTAYAVATRAWWLAAAAQLFLLPAAWLFVEQLSHDAGARFAALAPIGALALLSLATTRWFVKRPDAASAARSPLLALASAYRWVALGMSVWWVYHYVPEQEQTWAFAALGAGAFALAGWWRSREALLFSVAYTVTGLALMWFRPEPERLIYLPNLLAILALLAQQQAGRRLPARYLVESGAHTAAILVGSVSLWWYLSRWVNLSGSGFYLTASWSVLALVLLGAGIVLRERIYRWAGLGILAAALGRVVIFDVWKQETIYRVLTFMALGVVLLVLGFIYNKYQDSIRKWL